MKTEALLQDCSPTAEYDGDDDLEIVYRAFALTEERIVRDGWSWGPGDVEEDPRIRKKQRSKYHNFETSYRDRPGFEVETATLPECFLSELIQSYSHLLSDLIRVAISSENIFGGD